MRLRTVGRLTWATFVVSLGVWREARRARHDRKVRKAYERLA